MAVTQSTDGQAAKLALDSPIAGQAIADGTKLEDVWDEARLETALETLKEMHIQLRGLRTTIPRLIAPLTTKQPSPESLFRELSASASIANGEVREFGHLMTNEESRKALDHARKSRAANSEGIKPWRVTEHPDWLTKDT